MNTALNNLTSSEATIVDLFDDAIENDDLKSFESLFQDLLSSKLSQQMKLEILSQAMDTAYRGTKVTPSTQHSQEMVNRLSQKGISVPTYSFGPLVKIN